VIQQIIIPLFFPALLMVEAGKGGEISPYSPLLYPPLHADIQTEVL
jgi:hypothetical protein